MSQKGRIFVFKQKTAYEMRISDWSSDVCSSDLPLRQKRVEFLDVTKIFRQGDQDVVAVRDMSFTIYDQEFISIIGPSGCGKSTTLKLISGLDFPAAGTVRVDGETVTEPSSKVGFILQKDLLLPWRTILENVTIGLEMRGVSRAERRDRARDLRS